MAKQRYEHLSSFGQERHIGHTGILAFAVPDHTARSAGSKMRDNDTDLFLWLAGLLCDGF